MPSPSDTLRLHRLFPAAVHALTEWIQAPCTKSEKAPLTFLQDETTLVLHQIEYAHCSMTVYAQKASYEYDVYTAMTPIFFAILDKAVPQFLYHNVLDAMKESAEKKCQDKRIGCAFVRREEWCLMRKGEQVVAKKEAWPPVSVEKKEKSLRMRHRQ